MQTMDVDEITEVLITLRKQLGSDSRITCLSPSKNQKAWSGADYSKLYNALEQETQTEALYRVKYPPKHASPTLLSVTAELICARIGQRLFTIPLCPPFAIADPSSGTHEKGFGSKNLTGYKCVNLVNGNDLTEVKNIDPSILARIIVYHIWLVANDAEILIHEDGRKAFSIDHGFFLRWGDENMPPKEVYAELLAALDEKDIEVALNELESVEQRSIVEQFASIPKEWLPNGDRGIAVIAEKMLLRRAEVRARLTSMREM